MASAIAMLKGLGQKVGAKDRQDCTRTLHVNMPSPYSVDIEFSDVTLKVSEGLRSKSKFFFYLNFIFIFDSIVWVGQMSALVFFYI